MLALLVSLAVSYVGAEERSDFMSLCRATLAQSGDVSACGRLQSLFFSDGKVAQFAPMRPAQVGAPELPVDRKVDFLVFNDPNYVAGIAYCYFAFRKSLDPKQISPDTLGLSASGFAILNEELKPYQSWLETNPAGKACKKRVQEESGVSVANLEVSLRGKTALIALNPLAVVRQKGANWDALMKEMTATLNHERIHAYQVLCPAFEEWSRSQWKALAAPERERFEKLHPDYAWGNPKTDAREYAAFLLEGDPAQVKPHLGKCSL